VLVVTGILQSSKHFETVTTQVKVDSSYGSKYATGKVETAVQDLKLVKHICTWNSCGVLQDVLKTTVVKSFFTSAAERKYE